MNDLADRFPLQSFDKIRYADTDRQGHVNNAVFATFIETGRVELLYRPEQPLAGLQCAFVVVQLDLQLKGEIYWPGRVDIMGAVTKIGNSSMHLQQYLFQEDRHVASARTVLVQIHEPTKRPHPLTPQAREHLQKFLREENQLPPIGR